MRRKFLSWLQERIKSWIKPATPVLIIDLLSDLTHRGTDLIGSFRRECLDNILSHEGRHLERIVTKSTAYFNEERSHQGIDQRIPDYYEAPKSKPTSGHVTSKSILGGLHHMYARVRHLK